MAKVMKQVSEVSALLCGILEDNGRILFLVRKDERGREMLELPHALVKAGENEVLALTAAMREQAGIDAQVHEVIKQGKHNAGSRKKKRWVPALGFRATAKSAKVSLGKGFAGFRWIALREIGNVKLGRNSEWLR
jgi:hypothetical protein